MLKKGAITRISVHREGGCFLSTVFTVPKPEGIEQAHPSLPHHIRDIVIPKD